MTHIWIPNRNIYQEDDSIKRKIEIKPGYTSYEFLLKCPRCTVWMEINKKDALSDNKSFTCATHVTHMPEGLCGYTFAIRDMPDDIKHFLRDTTLTPIDVRPKITRV